MSFDGESLFRLLPALHRARDYEIAAGRPDALTPADRLTLTQLEALANPTAAQVETLAELRDRASWGPLRTLLDVFAGEIGAVEENLAQLYDDLFVETCAPWVLPYLGDLIGYRTLHGRAPRGDRRAELGHTIAFRRRKGTLAMLEQLAFDVTGWRARAVEFFQLLSTTQYMNHLRPRNRATVDLRDGLALERIDGPFSSAARALEVRRIRNGRGRYNVPNIGIFLWRLDAQRRGPSPATPYPADATGLRFRFSALGNDAPLHTRPAAETAITHLAEPLNVPMPITRRAFRAGRNDFYGPDASVAVLFDGVPLAVDQVRGCNLSDDGAGGWAHDAPSQKVAIDPVLGRLVLASDLAPPAKLEVMWHEAAPDEIGGGPYSRAAGFTNEPDHALFVVPSLATPTIQSALDAAHASQKDVVVEIVDNGDYAESLQVDVPAGNSLEIRAAEGVRPHLRLQTPMAITGGAGASVVLNGLLISGSEIDVPADAHELASLTIRHSTLVPGRTLDAAGAPSLPGEPSLTLRHPLTRLTIERTILGAAGIHPSVEAMVTDSVIDAGSMADPAWHAHDSVSFGGRVQFDGCTLIGRVRCRRLDASNSIFLAPTSVERLQEGCVRFCFLAPGSSAPRRYRCVPDAKDSPHDTPRFTTLRYGTPGYPRLTSRTPDSIWRGAEDETEMGVFHYRYEPQRESDLRIRLEEYLRVGLEAGIFYES